MSQQGADTTDRILDAITHKAEPLQEVTVATCAAMESAAAELDPLARAKAEVARVRETCDRVLAGFRALRVEQETARNIAQQVRDGHMSLGEAVRAALAVHEAYKATKAAVAELKGTD